MSADGRRIQYQLRGLGTPNVQASGGNGNLASIIRTRQTGADRPYEWSESGFDQYTGIRWNWVGSNRSGGATTRPGGIGNVEQPCLNPFDCAAKKHDIQAWLEANFDMGCDVSLWMDGRWQRFMVRSAFDVHREVAREFRAAAETTLNNAMALATKEGDRALIARIRALQDKLQSVIQLEGVPLQLGEVVRDIFNEPRIVRVL